MSPSALLDRRWKFEAHGPPSPPSWATALASASAADSQRDAAPGLVRQQLEKLPPEVLREVAEALRQWWPLRPRNSTGFELVVVHPDGTREKHQVYHRVLRIGRDPANALQLRSEVVSSEHCEIRADDARLWLVDLASSNGTRVDDVKIAAWEPKALEPGSRIELGPFRLVIGQSRTRFPDPPFVVRIVATSVHRGGFPSLLGTPDSPWVELATAPAAGGLRGWLRLPTTWLRSARHGIADAPAVAPTAALDTPLDYALTGYLLSQVAATFESRTGIPVTVSAPMPQAVLLQRRPEGEAFAVARFEVAVGDNGWLCDVVWPMPAAPKRRNPVAEGHLGELPMPVAVILGAMSLTPSDLAGLDRGDILVPDRWYPEHWIEDGSEAALGEVALRVQSWEAPGRLRFEKGFFHLEPTSAWTVRPQGDAMPPTRDDRRDDTAEHDLAAADPTRMLDELEVTVAFELERFPVPLRELADWREGGLVRLDHRPEDPIRLVLHHGGKSRLLGYGRVVVVDERLGVQIDRWLGAEESR